MAINKARDTHNISQERLVVDMRDEIALQDPNESPFVTFLKLAKKNTRTVHNPKFDWLEDDIVGNKTVLGADVTASDGATTITVADGTIFRAGDVIMVNSAERCLVTGVNDKTLTVIRGFGTSSVAAAESGDNVVIIGKAYMENDLAPAVISTKEVDVYNYTQIFRTPFALSNTEDKAELYGAKDRAHQRKKALLEHKRDIAMSMYFGEMKLDTSGEHVRRTMKGLLGFLNQGVAFSEDDLPLTYENFDSEVAQKAFRYGSKEKLLIAGPKLMNKINSWAMNKVLTDISREKTFGMRVKNLVTTYGDLKVIYDPLLADAGYFDSGIIVDTDNVRYVAYNGRDTKLFTNIQENDRDGIMDEYRTECSLEVRLPKTHMLLTGCY